MKTMRSTKSLRIFSLPVGLLFSVLSCGFTQTSISTIPAVTVVATVPIAHWSGGAGAFTVFRSGNPVPALNVYCCIGGTASNGVDYQTITSFVPLASGVMSNTVIVQPINLGQTNLKTVTLDLCPSPLMMPVNYAIGSPSSATVYIAPAGVTNRPPMVNIVSPTNGATYPSPANITLLARASDPDGSITKVEFFAGDQDLGQGLPVVLDPLAGGGVTGLVYLLNWAKVPPNAYSLTAMATDDAGFSTVSAPVNITVFGPPTNTPPVVRITSPPNGAVFHAPMTIPLYAYAADPDGTVASVEFFADSNSLGFGQPVTAVPPPLPPGNVQPPILVVVPTNYWRLLWTNAPLGTNIALTAKATDNGGAATISLPLRISILPSPPPPTNRPALVGIVATDPVAIEGTNCWPWLALTNPVPTWSNWVSPTAVFCYKTNCGPKNATFTVFRIGATNDDLSVNYLFGGSATNGIDYVALPGSVLIPAGQRQTAIPVIPLDDGPPDRNSSVILKLAPGTNYLVGSPMAAAAIILDRQFPQASAAGMIAGKAFHVSAAGPDGAWFHVEYTTDLIHWTPVCTNQVVNGGMDFIDPDAAGQPGRFYRTVPEPNPPQF